MRLPQSHLAANAAAVTAPDLHKTHARAVLCHLAVHAAFYRCEPPLLRPRRILAHLNMTA